MKIAIAQINTTIGDFDGNTAKITSAIESSRINGADLVIFPEMTVTGYPPKDLLDKPHFILKNLDALDRIAAKTDARIAAVVGYVSVNEATTGKGLFNSAAFLHNGKVEGIQHKTLLPTYDVFDEARYFEPGNEHNIINYKGRRFGITVCEDIWSTADFKGRKLYSVDPVKILVEKGVEFIVNISASPYVVGKRRVRETLLSSVAAQYGFPIIYVNLVGGNDELIFDGCSMVVRPDGTVAREGAPFAEDEFIIDVDDIRSAPKKEFFGDVEEIFDALVLGLKDYVRKCGFKKTVVGLSGGIDSAVVAVLAVKAVGPENVTAIIMPTRHTAKRSIFDAKALVKNLGIKVETVNIDRVYQNYLDLLRPHFKGRKMDTTEENLQARIRGNILMAFSNKFGAMVLSTGNKSEIAVGYCTLYGDLAGGLAVVSDVPKTMIYKLAGYINRDGEVIPESIIRRPPTAELRDNQTDQDILPPYDVLDRILKEYVEDRLSVQSIIDMGFEREVVDKVVRMIDSSEYKRRQAPPGLKVTSKAFGWGRRHPIACKC